LLTQAEKRLAITVQYTHRVHTAVKNVSAVILLSFSRGATKTAQPFNFLLPHPHQANISHSSSTTEQHNNTYYSRERERMRAMMRRAAAGGIISVGTGGARKRRSHDTRPLGGRADGRRERRWEAEHENVHKTIIKSY